MSKLLFVAVAIIFSLTLQAQLTKPEMEDLITNGSSRNWQFLTYKKTLGAECDGDGQLYTFFNNGKLQRKRCINKKTEFQEVTWKLIPVSEATRGEWQIQLSQPIEIAKGSYVQTMRVDLPLGKMHEKNKKMILRVVPDCKACVEQDVTLTSMN